jgi:hypothetical protein
MSFRFHGLRSANALTKALFDSDISRVATNHPIAAGYGLLCARPMRWEIPLVTVQVRV